MRDSYTLSPLMPTVGQAIDVACELQPAAGDAEYLEALSGALAQAFDRFSPDLIIYNAGTDILAGALGSVCLWRACSSGKAEGLCKGGVAAGACLHKQLFMSTARFQQQLCVMHSAARPACCPLCRRPAGQAAGQPGGCGAAR